MTLQVNLIAIHVQAIGEAGTQLHSSINSAIDGGEWVASRSGHTAVGKRTLKVHLIGG
jgi:hypothetical protein